MNQQTTEEENYAQDLVDSCDQPTARDFFEDLYFGLEFENPFFQI